MSVEVVIAKLGPHVLVHSNPSLLRPYCYLNLIVVKLSLQLSSRQARVSNNVSKITKLPRGRTLVCSFNGLIFILQTACLFVELSLNLIAIVYVRFTISIRDRPCVC
jgi:hypothetical protein